MRWRGAGSGVRWRGAGSRVRWRGAGSRVRTGGHLRGAATGGHWRGAATGGTDVSSHWRALAWAPLEGTAWSSTGGHWRGAATGAHWRGAATGGHWRGAATGGHWRGAATGGHWRGAATGGHWRGAATGGRSWELDGTSRGSGELDGTSRGSGELDRTSRGSGELDRTSRGSGELDGTSRGSGELDGTSRSSGESSRGAGTGELWRLTPIGLAISPAGGLAGTADGGGLGRRGADFSADRTDVTDGSSTFAPRSALLEAHLRARGNTRECGGLQPLVRHLGVTSDGTSARDRRLSRHRITVSCQFRLEVSGSSTGWWKEIPSWNRVLRTSPSRALARASGMKALAKVSGSWLAWATAMNLARSSIAAEGKKQQTKNFSKRKTKPREE